MNARNTDGLMQDGPGPAISRAWNAPRLSTLGEVCSLTESGSANGMEDLITNGQCVFMIGPLNVGNTTYNMC